MLLFVLHIALAVTSMAAMPEGPYWQCVVAFTSAGYSGVALWLFINRLLDGWAK